MTNECYPWPYYAELQLRSRKLPRMSDYWWGIERGLEYILNAIETGTVPANPDDLVETLNRTIASGARLNRSHSAALLKYAPLTEHALNGAAAAEARIEFNKILRGVSEADAKTLTDAGYGYTDREIAGRRGSSAGAIRVRLSRLRLKLAA